MCGICGFVSPKVVAQSKQLLQEMVTRLEHRGPDDCGHFWADPTGVYLHQDKVDGAHPVPNMSLGFGHTRLSIIDLSRAGRQPMSNEDGSLWMTFNGEVYNFKEIRAELEGKGHRFRSQTDTEVVLHAYEEWGPDSLKRFNGMFALAIFDLKEQSVFLARDRLGIKPLYWHFDSGKLAFASELKALLPLPWVNRAVDWQGLMGHLLFLWCPEPRTAFEGIKKLPAGHWLKWKDGQIECQAYWEMPLGPGSESFDESEYLERLDALMNQVVSRRMISDVPVGVFLSGGLDSSLIAALMNKMTDQKTTSYTIAFDETDKTFEAMPDDQLYARKMASFLDSDHREITIHPNITDLLPKMLWHLEEPIADPAAINTYLICKMAKERGTTVMLSGMGADEIFAGYRKHLSVSLAGQYKRWMPHFMREGVIRPIVDRLPVASAQGGYRLARWARRFTKSASLPHLDCFIGNYAYYNAQELQEMLTPAFQTEWQDAYAIQRHRDHYQKVQGQDLVSQMTYLDTNLFLPGLNLAYSDKASMAASVEVRVPFVDHEMVEFALTLPSKHRLRGLQQKYLLKKFGQRILPNEIANRPKAPFGAPLRSWMHRDLAGLIDEYLSEKSVNARGYFKYDMIRQTINDNRSGRQDYGHRLWGLLTIEMWHRIFIDGDGSFSF